jgi:hypothetical protein
MDYEAYSGFQTEIDFQQESKKKPARWVGFFTLTGLCLCGIFILSVYNNFI